MLEQASLIVIDSACFVWIGQWHLSLWRRRMRGEAVILVVIVGEGLIAVVATAVVTQYLAIHGAVPGIFCCIGLFSFCGWGN